MRFSSGVFLGVLFSLIGIEGSPFHSAFADTNQLIQEATRIQSNVCPLEGNARAVKHQLEHAQSLYNQALKEGCSAEQLELVSRKLLRIVIMLDLVEDRIDQKYGNQKRRDREPQCQDALPL